jgi:hypothetical protein
MLDECMTARAIENVVVVGLRRLRTSTIVSDDVHASPFCELLFAAINCVKAPIKSLGP